MVNIMNGIRPTLRSFRTQQRLMGGGSRIFTNGSGIGSDSSMIAANHRMGHSPIQRACRSYTSSTFEKAGVNQNSEISAPSFVQRSTFSSKESGGMDDEYGEMTADGHTYVHPEPFILENGAKLHNAQLRYMTYGTLNKARDNVLVVCHALTGNASLHSWWGDLLGPGLAFDTDKYFIVCSNILGSCYGSSGPASYKKINKEGEKYGIDFPDVSVQDTVRLQLHMLRDDLEVNSIKCVIGGSFGGMQAVEYGAQAGKIDSPFAVDDKNGRASPFVRSVMPIACGAAHTAWQIAMSEVQRQAFYVDPKWNNGKPSPDYQETKSQGEIMHGDFKVPDPPKDIMNGKHETNDKSREFTLKHIEESNGHEKSSRSGINETRQKNGVMNANGSQQNAQNFEKERGSQINPIIVAIDSDDTDDENPKLNHTGAATDPIPIDDDEDPSVDI